MRIKIALSDDRNSATDSRAAVPGERILPPVLSVQDKLQAQHNADARIYNKTEGYWRQSVNDKSDKLPWPVPHDVVGYDKDKFLDKLSEVEKEAESIGYRGYSIHRLTNQLNGSREFRHKGWRWPEGLRSYIQHGVPPTREFHMLITGIDVRGLPEYKEHDL
jgi:hypothetical protein